MHQKKLKKVCPSLQNPWKRPTFAVMDERFWCFVREHRDEDVRGLMLRAERFPGVDVRAAAVQVEGWQTARGKLPLWASTEGILFPEHLSMEQCSSQRAAEYKGSLAVRLAQGLQAMANESAPICDEPRRTAISHLNNAVRHSSLFTLAFGDTAPARQSQINLSLRSLTRSVHSSLFRVADLTGGFGVDAAMIVRALQAAGWGVVLTWVERQSALCALAEHNLPLLGVERAEIRCGEAEEALAQLPPQHLIYIDPSRRDAHGGRVSALADCQPDVSRLLPLLMEKSEQVLVKLSPMLDLTEALRSLPAVEVHVVSVEGECKELLLLLSASATESEPLIHCVNIGANQTSLFRFTRSEEQSAVCTYAEGVGAYLFEPDASVMKAAAFRTVARRFGLSKLHPNSHLYTAPALVTAFPGRMFRVLGTCSVGRRPLQALLRGLSDGSPSLHLAVRNFPLSADALRKQLGVREGGSRYLFATTLMSGRRCLVLCERVADD